MAKRILVVAASPRKDGNSDLLCERFIEGALEAGNIVEEVFLREQVIGFCRACDYCRDRDGACALRDDAASVLDKMAEADVVVLATPVYFYTMDAQMKVLIDRTVARYATLANKEFYFIATMADGAKALMERTFEGLRGFTDCLPGAVERGVVCGAGAWAKGDIEGSPAMDEAYEMGLRA